MSLVAVAVVVAGLVAGVPLVIAGGHDHPDVAGPARPRLDEGLFERLTVTGSGVPPALSDQVRRDADDALGYVRGVWDGPWSDHVVVEIPVDDAGFRARAGRMGAGGEAAIAVTPVPAETGPDGPGVGRVILRREVYERLSAQGRQVVLRHELTHLASAAVTGSGTLLWLVEGLAETVGHAGVPLATTRAAAELAADVRSGWLPDALPSDAQFSAADGTILRSYQEAWLACRLIADRLGLGGLISFYRQVGSGRGDPQSRLDGAFRAFLGTTEAGFVAQWRSYLRAGLSPS